MSTFAQVLPGCTSKVVENTSLEVAKRAEFIDFWEFVQVLLKLNRRRPPYRPKRRLGSELETRTNGGRRMPAYYFHVRDHGTLIRDPDGIDLPDLKGVRDEIRKSVLSVLQDEQAADVSPDLEFQIEDASGRIVLVVPFRLAQAPVAVAC